MNSSERQQNAKIIFQKLELIGFSEMVRNEVKKELPKLNHDSFKLPVRQVSNKKNIQGLDKEKDNKFRKNFSNFLRINFAIWKRVIAVELIGFSQAIIKRCF